jgi:hypothetical protein
VALQSSAATARAGPLVHGGCTLQRINVAEAASANSTFIVETRLVDRVLFTDIDEFGFTV